MKNNKGLSEVVTTVIMIALVMAAAAIIWGVVSSLIQKQTGNAEACFGNYDKVTLYGAGTCIEPLKNTAGDTILSVYINVADVMPDKIIVSISTASEAKSFEIPGTDINAAPYVVAYNTAALYNTQLLNITKNSGKRYLVKLTSTPTLVTISPVIGGSQCGISDEIKEIATCTS